MPIEKCGKSVDLNNRSEIQRSISGRIVSPSSLAPRPLPLFLFQQQVFRWQEQVIMLSLCKPKHKKFLFQAAVVFSEQMMAEAAGSVAQTAHDQYTAR